MPEELPCQPAVRRALAQWHHMVAAKELGGLEALLADDVTFRSPMAHKPYEGVGLTATILRTVLQVFEDFAYHRQLCSADGLNVVLEFSARVGTRQLKGVDLIRFDAEGQIREFEVMVRPMSGLQALGEAMAQRLAGTLG